MEPAAPTPVVNRPNTSFEFSEESGPPIFRCSSRPDVSNRSKSRSLLNHLVGESLQRQRYGEAKRLRGLEVDDESEFGPEMALRVPCRNASACRLLGHKRTLTGKMAIGAIFGSISGAPFMR
jgi:hypothetical protein